MRETLAKSWGCRTSSVQDATRGVLPCLDGLTYRKPYLYISLRVRVSRKKVPNNPMPAHYIVKLNSLCNLNCCFCADSIEARGVPDFKYDALIKGLERNRQLHDSLIISGGEPTIYPNLLPFLHHAKKVCGYKRISLTTNGVMLSSQKNADALIHAGVDAFLVSFSTSHERMFDAIVKKEGSFQHTVQGIRNIKARGKEARINSVLHKLNHKNVANTVEFLIGLGVDSIQLSWMNPVGSSIVDGKSAIAVSYAEALPFIREVFERANRLGYSSLFIENMPICIAPELTSRISDLRKPAENKGYYNAEKTKPEKCGACALAGICDGVWKAYLAQFGDGELNPVSSAGAEKVWKGALSEGKCLLPPAETAQQAP